MNAISTAPEVGRLHGQLSTWCNGLSQDCPRYGALYEQCQSVEKISLLYAVLYTLCCSWISLDVLYAISCISPPASFPASCQFCIYPSGEGSSKIHHERGGLCVYLEKGLDINVDWHFFSSCLSLFKTPVLHRRQSQREPVRQKEDKKRSRCCHSAIIL